MPPKGSRSAAQRAHLAQLGSGRLSETSLLTVEQLQQMLAASQSKLLAAEAQLAKLDSALESERLYTQRCLEDLQLQVKQNAELSALLAAEKKLSGELKTKARVERRACQRANLQKNLLRKQIQILKSAESKSSAHVKTATNNAEKAIYSLIRAEKENSTLKSELSQCLQRCQADMNKCRTTVLALTKKLRDSKAVTRNLEKKNARATAVHENSLRRARAKVLADRSVHRLFNKGTFTNKTRNLVRLLIQAGCSQGYITQVIHAVFNTAGITVIGDVSRRSVSRIVAEGFIAAQVQLGHEMKNASSMTFSADGTMHRSINYNSRHVNLKVESYSADPQQVGTVHATRSLGLHSTLDGTSEQAIESWKELLGNINEIYNASPLAKRTGSLLRTVDIFVKLAGMNTDHCAKEKKDAYLLQQEKQKATFQTLGEDQILQMSNQELLPDFLEAQRDMIESAGGKKKWECLSQLERDERQAATMEKLVIRLGKEHYDTLSDDEKRILKLFIWAGCGCHKDLNTVRGGNSAMMAWWKDNNVTAPVLLANRDNAAILKGLSKGSDTPTSAQEHAFQMTSRGGVKTTQLAGDILNNKNDKKGHHDTFRLWWNNNVGVDFTFPDTSNNRFQSHCQAAAALIEHLPHFIKFLEFVQAKKQQMRFSHMESNLWKALHCNATKTELAVLALYAQAISHPYMRAVRKPGNAQINMLDLGPLHSKVQQHMRRIIDDPSLLISATAVSESGSIDGQPWNAPDTIKAIHKLAPELPHLKEVLVAFFRGACETWTRFTSEFAPGGLIDEATAEEKDIAWMPPTNDANEGVLGSFRVLLRRQPQLTLMQFNAQAMYTRNNTEAFMAKKFQLDDHQYIRRLAREENSRGVEKQRKREMIQHAQAKVNKRLEASQKRQKNVAERAQRVAAVKLIFDKNQVMVLKGQALKDHLKAFQNAGAPNVKTMTAQTVVTQIREGLKAAIDLYNSGEWKPVDHSQSGELSDDPESAEEFNLDDAEDEWEDI